MTTRSRPIALITGASRGIGRALALALAADGHDLALQGRDLAALGEVSRACEELGARVSVQACELGDRAQVDALVPAVLEALGGLDVLVHNAGVMERGPVEEADPDALDRLLEVNVHAVLRLTRRALPALRESPRAAVISIASRAGKQSFAGMASYCASKHALVGFSNSLFEELRDRGVKVSVICPGLVETEMVQDWDLDLSKFLAAEDVAQAVQYVLACSPRACPTEILLQPQRNPYG